MSWSIPVMGDAPFHLLTCIFVGWIEPQYPGRERVIFVIDHEAEESSAYSSNGCVDNLIHPDTLSEVTALTWELQMAGYDYQAGAVIEGHLTDGENQGFLVRNVMSLAALGNRFDANPLCVRRAEMLEAFGGQSFTRIAPVLQVGFMSQRGVIDEDKLRAVARDLDTRELVLCNNYSNWRTDNPKSTITGRNDPGWVTWHVPDGQ